MVGTKFLVQWEEHPTHLATRLGYLLEHQSLVDVTLMCNTHSLKVHRSVLAACSPYFESVLQKQLGNQPLIVLKDMKFSVLKSLVEFMYCGETSVTEENLSPLMEAAKFFEVKGLSSMTKEAIGDRSSTPLQSPISSVNGITSSGRGGRRPGAGRGRRPASLPVTQTPLTNPPTESAQILLSLSGNSSQALQNANRNVRINPNTRIGKVFSPDNNILEGHKPYIRNGSLGAGDAGSRPIRGGYEPRRRGRRRNPANIAYNRTNLAYKESEASRIAVENLQKEMDGHCDQKERPTLDSKLSLWNTNNVDKSPLLASLLSKAEHFGSKIKTENEDSSTCENSVISDGETLVYQVDGDTIQGSNMKYLEALKEAGLPTDVPILIDNGDGNYITLTEDVLMNVMEGKEEFQFQVTEGTFEGHEVGEGVVLQDGSIVMERKRNNDICAVSGDKKENHGVRQFVVKEMQATRSDEEDVACIENFKKDGNKNGGKMSVQEIINEAVLESLKSDSKEAELDPDAVVLFEVTEDSKVEKYVVSSKEVNVLKALNEQIVQRKKHLQDVKKTPLQSLGVVGGNTKIAEVKLTIGKSKSTKSILSQVLECAQEKLKESNKAIKPPEPIEKKDVVKGQSQLVEIEFIDGNGERIEGYQVEGTMVTDKQFEETSAQHSDNTSSKDDDVMNLLTLDQEMTESNRIDSNIENETGMDLVETNDRGDVQTMNSNGSEILEENYDEVECSKRIDNYKMHKGNEDVIVNKDEDNLCVENTEHLDANKVQNLVINSGVQSLDSNEVQNVAVTELQNIDGNTSQLALHESGECKVMSVEQALEAMMGVDESLLMKDDSNIDVRDDSNIDTPDRENSNIDMVEREDNIVNVPGREANDIGVLDRLDSNIGIVEREDSTISTEEREDSNMGTPVRVECNIDIAEREDSSIDIVEREDSNLDVVLRDDSNIGIAEREDSNIGIAEQEDSSICMVEREDSNIDLVDRGESHVEIIKRETCNSNICSQEDSNIVCVTGQRDCDIDVLQSESSHINITDREDIISDIEADENTDICREDSGICFSGKDNSNSGVIEVEESNTIIAEKEDCQLISVQSDMSENAPVIECESDSRSLSVLNEHSSHPDSEFQEYFSGKVENESTLGSNKLIMAPAEEMVLNSLGRVEKKMTDIINDVLDSQSGKENEMTENENCVTSPTKDVPFAVGLLPIKTALEKICTIPEHQPRKTRSSSTSKEENIVPKRRYSVGISSSEPVEKKMKINDEVMSGESLSVYNEQTEVSTEEVGLCNNSS